MEEKIFDIVTDLIRGDIGKDQAIINLLDLHSIRNTNNLNMDNLFENLNTKTKEQILTNLILLIRENEKMKQFEAFTLGQTLNCSNTDSVRWTFLKKILPELNQFFIKKYEEYQLEENNKEIKRLEDLLKNMI